MEHLDQKIAVLMTHLQKATSVAQMWHWKVKSFSLHMALGDLYEGLQEMMDEFFEMYMGRYGTESHIEMSDPNAFSEQDPMEFISQLCSVLDHFEKEIPQDGFLVNKFQEIQALAYRTKYKMENLR